MPRDSRVIGRAIGRLSQAPLGGPLRLSPAGATL
jgi:hypothetical protein